MPRYDFLSSGNEAGLSLEDYLIQREQEKAAKLLQELQRRQIEAQIQAQETQTDIASAEEGRAADAAAQADADRADLENRQNRAALVQNAAAATRTIPYAAGSDTTGLPEQTPGILMQPGQGMFSMADHRDQQGLRDDATGRVAAEQGARAQAASRDALMGMDLPEGVLPAILANQADLDLDPEDFREPEPDKPLVQNAGSQGIFERMPDGTWRVVPGSATPRDEEGGGGSPAQNAYAEQSRDRLRQVLGEIRSQVSPNTVGTWRAMFLRLLPLPGTIDPTVDMDAAITQANALLGFNELNAMRAASPTGGALGQVSERELTYLQSVAANLDPNQHPDTFRAQLQKLAEEVDRVVNYGLDGAGDVDPTASVATPGGGGGVVRWGRDENGRPVRLQ